MEIISLGIILFLKKYFGKFYYAPSLLEMLDTLEPMISFMSLIATLLSNTGYQFFFKNYIH